jgi:transposase InsO family protein
MAGIGVAIAVFCRLIGLVRSTYYRWSNREAEGRLENEKPIARNRWWTHPMEKVHAVLYWLGAIPEIATNYVLATKAGISQTAVRKIRKKWCGCSEAVASVSVVAKATVARSYAWLAKHACWSMDTMQIRFIGGWLYAMLVMEEYSRFLLGYRLVGKKLGVYARELLLATALELGIRPLVLKHDRGSEFENYDFQEALREERIMSLPAPGHYAPFNGRLERGIRTLRNFTRPLEARYDATLEEVEKALSRGRYVVNEEMPRRIFDGETARTMYDAAEPYRPEEREKLVTLIVEKEKRLQGKFFLKGLELDKQRAEAVNWLCGENLCEVGFRYDAERGDLVAGTTLSQRVGRERQREDGVSLPLVGEGTEGMGGIVMVAESDIVNPF